jgi:hypothetical protein
MRPEIVYVPIRNPEVRSVVLACCISDEGTPVDRRFGLLAGLA